MAYIPESESGNVCKYQPFKHSVSVRQITLAPAVPLSDVTH
jgi:hypothetical protein